MIALHRLNAAPLVINAMHILTIEATPDTLLTLTTGEKLLVRESCDAVVAAVHAYHCSLGPLAAGRVLPVKPVDAAEE